MTWSRYAFLVAGMALFGSATPVSKIVGEAFPSFLASGLRMATAAAVLLPFMLARNRGEAARLSSLSGADRARLAAIAVVGTFGFTLFLFYGLREAPGAVASVVMATTPAVTAAGAVLFLRSSLGWARGLAIGLGVAGVLLVSWGTRGGEGDVLWLGVLLVFGAVCCEAAYTLLGKELAAELSPIALTLAAAVLAGVLFTPPAVAQAVGFEWGAPVLTDWIALAWWGAGTMGLGSVLWFRGVMDVSGATASGFMAVMPVSALLLSYLLLDEGFEWAHAAGMAIVVAAIAALTYREYSASEREAE